MKTLTRAARSPLTHADRAALRALWGNACAYCRRTPSDGARWGRPSAWQIDHLTPVSLGGPTRLNNLAFACSRCNRWKSGLTAERYGRRDVRERAEQLAAQVIDFLLFDEPLDPEVGRLIVRSPLCCQAAGAGVLVG